MNEVGLADPTWKLCFDETIGEVQPATPHQNIEFPLVVVAGTG